MATQKSTKTILKGENISWPELQTVAQRLLAFNSENSHYGMQRLNSSICHLLLRATLRSALSIPFSKIQSWIYIQ